MLTDETVIRRSQGWRRYPRHLAVAVAAALFASRAFGGVAFGIYDARTLAMGGAAVASASNDNAYFYNAALLAFNDEIEERTRDSRVLLPILTPQLSRSAFDVEDIASEDLGADLSGAIDAYNNAPGSDAATDAASAATALRRAVAELDGDDLFGDIYVGLAVSEPGKRRGAGFFLGTRFVAGGRSNVDAQDLETLAAYEEGLRFLASGGSDGTARPELFDGNGALIDPVDGFESTAAASGLSITEVGVAIASNFTVRGVLLASGMSFKVLDVDTFEDTERLVDDRIDVSRNEESKVRVNVDLGLAKDISSRWRLGVAVKDAIPYDFETSLGNKIRLRPRPRAAVAYAVGRLQTSFDLDLIQHKPLANESATQDAALGFEWAALEQLKLRAGLRADLRGGREPVASAGFGLVFRRLAVDMAYAEGSDLRAAALQLGLVF